MASRDPGDGQAGARAGGRPRTKPAEVRRAELMAAAERLFLAQGLEATTVEQITREAGVAKGSFYLQFATKEELLAALRRDFLESYLEELDAVLADVPAEQHAARLAVWTAVTLSVFLERGALRRLLFEAARDYAPPRSDARGSGSASAGAGALGRLAGLLRAGGWSLGDPEGAATFLFHGLLGLLDAEDPGAVASGRAREALEETAMTLVERLVVSAD